MADGGWIKLYRSVRSNWLWENGNERYAKWWMDILMMVNHEPRKILVNGQLVTIGVGERLTSISKLAAGWGATRRTVDKFLQLLVQDDMISLKKSKTEGTRVKVLHYADYQVFEANPVQGVAQQKAQREAQQGAQREAHKQEPKEPKNEKNKSSSSARSDVLDFWQQNGFGPMAPKVMQDLDFWVRDLQAIGASEASANQLLIKAMSVAIDNGARNYGYVNGVLRNWEGKGFTAPEAVDAFEAERAAQRTAKRPGSGRRQNTRAPIEGHVFTDEDLPF